MATFFYSAKTQTGELAKGQIVASDELKALNELKKQKLLVIELLPQRRWSTPLLSRRVSLFEKMTFTKQLAVMVKAGLPLTDSLEIQASQTANNFFGQILRDVKTSISGGEGLAQALAKHKQVFNQVYVAMVAAGEKSGQLDKVLTRLGQSLDQEYELIGKIKGALYYPIFIFVVLISVVIFILIFVIPQLRKIFDEAGVALPFLTRMLLMTSGFVANYFWLVIITGVIAVAGLRFSMRMPSVRHSWDFIQLKLPIFGKFYQKIYLERFARTFSSLIAAGIPILDVISTTNAVVTNTIYQKELGVVRQAVERGQSISQAMREQHHFPVVIANLLAIGEKTGNLSQVAEDLADFYGKEIDQTAKNLSSLLEPLIMVAMGIGVGLVVAAVVLPIYRLIGVAG